MRSIRGNIVDYSLPTIMLGVLLGASVFSLSNPETFSTFFAASTDGKVKSNDLIAIGGNSQTNSDWSASVNPSNTGGGNGSPGNPVVNCNNGYCSIDFGDISLTGLPQDINQFIETSGASGGTDIMMDILTQLANQLELNGQTAEANLIKDLANLGHNIARIQEGIETSVENCSGNSSCISNALNNTIMSQPPGFNTQVGTFPTGLSYYDMRDTTLVSGARAVINGSEPYTDTRMTMEQNPAFQYISKYNEVMAQGTIDPTIKSLINQLTWTMGTSAEGLDDLVWAVRHSEFDGTVQGGWRRDTLSGDVYYPQMDFTGSGVIDSFNNYNANELSDFTSALTCSVGNNADTGRTCGGTPLP